MVTPTTGVTASGLIFESREKENGTSLLIPLTLKGSIIPIGNMDMTLGYDPSVLQADKVVMGSLTGSAISDYQISNGTIQVSFALKDSFKGDGTVAYVSFKVIGSDGQTSKLDISSASGNDAAYASVPIPVTNGIFRVVAPGKLKGDINGDGKVSAIDALMALQMAVDKIPDDPAADLNGDGKITSIDAKSILKLAVGG